MASSIALPLAPSGKARSHSAAGIGNPGGLGQSRLSFPMKIGRSNSRRTLSVRADYSDGSRGGGAGDFIAGFLLGGVLCGAITYIYAPQLRRAILNEDEHGFRRRRGPLYDEDGLELEYTRQTLADKIGQLNSAIDKVSSKLLGGKSKPPKPTTEEVEGAV